MTDNEATRTTFVRTRPALHEAGCYEAEAKNFGLNPFPHIGFEDVTSLHSCEAVTYGCTMSVI